MLRRPFQSESVGHPSWRSVRRFRRAKGAAGEEGGALSRLVSSRLKRQVQYVGAHVTDSKRGRGDAGGYYSMGTTTSMYARGWLLGHTTYTQRGCKEPRRRGRSRILLSRDGPSTEEEVPSGCHTCQGMATTSSAVFANDVECGATTPRDGQGTGSVLRGWWPAVAPGDTKRQMPQLPACSQDCVVM